MNPAAAWQREKWHMATTEETSPSSGPDNEFSAAVEGPYSERRRAARELLARQRTQLDRLENELPEQLQQLVDEVAQSARMAEAAATDGESAALSALQAQFEALKNQYATLDAETEQLRGQLEQAQVERGRAEQELRVRETLLKEAQAGDEQRHVELATIREQLADAQAQLTAAHQRQAALDRELAEEREQAVTQREETKAQRRRIARELKHQHAEQLAEVERRQAELQALGESHDTRLAEQAASAQAELTSAVDELNELRETLAHRTDELEAARRQIESLDNAVPAGSDTEALAQLQQERDKLLERLAQAESATKQAAGDGPDREAWDDLQRRFEMAVEEVRELKGANAELEDKLKNRPAAAAPAAQPTGLDWEAQKQRLLAALEADDDEPADEETVEERANIEGTIRITDQIVAQKDEEIADLKRLLEENGGSSTDKQQQTAVDNLLDADDLVRQEREKLAQTQAEWREKIGQAEIDISVERAKIAREQAELEERVRQFESQHQPAESNKEADDGKPARGRWLARLGLNADDSK